MDSVDWLFWVGCAGAYEDRAKKTVRAVAELLDLAGVSFGVLGNGETCTGDPARRAGNEFVFQGLAQQNVETLTRVPKVKQVVTTCPHCLNTLKNEYRDLGLELEVVHHTQLLNRLVREGRLTPVTDGAGAAKRSITYHDPCYLGRHNQVYAPPRELLQVLPGASYVEMERSAERSFCCGAGGARMWMEENIGERINVNRTKEAVATGADQIAVGCPFCRVMLSDGLTSEQADGHAREEVEVLDVAQMLLASVKGESATRTVAALAAALPRRGAPPQRGDPGRAAGRRRHPDRGHGDRDRRRRPGRSRERGSSLFDLGGDDEPEPAPVVGRAGALAGRACGPRRPPAGPRCSTSGRRGAGSRCRARACRPRAPRPPTWAAARCSTSAPPSRHRQRRSRHPAPTTSCVDRNPSRRRPPPPRPRSPTSGSLFDIAAPSPRPSRTPSPTPEPAAESPRPEAEPSRSRDEADRRPRPSRRQSPGPTPTSTRAAPCSTSEPPLTCGDDTVTPFDVN